MKCYSVPSSVRRKGSFGYKKQVAARKKRVDGPVWKLRTSVMGSVLRNLTMARSPGPPSTAYPVELFNLCLCFILPFITGIPNPQARVFVLGFRKLLNFSNDRWGSRVSLFLFPVLQIRDVVPWHSKLEL